MSKKLFIGLGAVVLLAFLGTSVYVFSAVRSVPQLFKRNAALKAQGYYMAEFEFKMVALQYYLNEGRYVTAISTLRRIQHEMATTRGLVRMPQSPSPQAMTAFLLDRQHPSTGAFMDPAYPYFTYISPTLNAVEALTGLSSRTGHPFKLKYPLRFLDKIDTPHALRQFLDSHLYLRAVWAGFGGPGPYEADSELAYFDELERAGVYRFSDDWKATLREWFYETQDPATGFWGTRIGTPGHWRQSKDANSTYHVLHLVLDAHGNNRSEKYPLRYAGTLAHNLLLLLDKPIPRSATAQHDWGLVQAQGTETITRLWSHFSETDRTDVRAAMRKFLAERYRFYRPKDGGFSLYTASDHADVDGTANALKLLRATGCLPGTWERQRLWGKAIVAGQSVEAKDLQHWSAAVLPEQPRTNSIRVYAGRLPRDNALDDEHLVLIDYPKGTEILDLMDLRQRLAHFMAASGNEFGNWSSKQDLAIPLHIQGVHPIPVTKGDLDLSRIADAHPETGVFYVVGYDLFQVPLYTIAFRLHPPRSPDAPDRHPAI